MITIITISFKFGITVASNAAPCSPRNHVEEVSTLFERNLSRTPHAELRGTGTGPLTTGRSTLLFSLLCTVPEDIKL